MKTNHQRGFVDPGIKGPGWYVRTSRLTGFTAAAFETFYDGHQGLARARRAAKRGLRQSERRYHRAVAVEEGRSSAASE